MRPLLSNIACPSPETLSAFLLGDLPETELSEVAAHVSGCAACEEQASQLDSASDEIVECLRRLPGCNADVPVADAGSGSSSEIPTFPAGTESWGEFRIVREIGRGGMGVVCEAYQGSLNRHVALKLLPAHGDLARFRREAKAAGRLHHTNIVPVFGVGEHQGRAYYVMQYIAGCGLDVVLKERAARGGAAACFGDREAARIAIQVAEALAYAHTQGVIHRDIKPSNLLLDGQQTVWVTDFGLAHDASDTLTLTESGDFLGTLRYAAPERFSGRGDERADIYGLGVTLYQLVCGRPAFAEADRSALLRQVLHEAPPAPRQCRPRIARDLETIVLKAIEREPQARYATAAALAEDLRRFLENRPIAMRRTPAWERAVRWCRRNPVVAGMTATVFFSLVALAAVASIGYAQTKWALDREAKQLAAAVRAEASAQLAADRARTAEQEMQLQWYAATVNLMKPAWESGQMLRLRSLLAETESYPDRGFEWYYLRQLSHLEEFLLVGHLATVGSVSWSPDGKRLATASRDGTAKVWDAASAKVLLILKGHASGIWAIAWSPEGKRVATASVDGTAIVWDALSGRQLFTLTGHTGQVCAVAWSPAGNRLATGSWDKTIRLWDTARGEQLSTIEDAKDGAKSVSFSPDGKLLAAANSSGVLRLWDVALGRQVSARQAHSAPIHSICWSPDGKEVATASADGIVNLWDHSSPKPRQSLKGHSGEVLAVAWSPDGRQLATGSRDRTARICASVSGRTQLFFKGHTGEVLSVSWSPDGKWLATGCDDGTAKVWPAWASREWYSLACSDQSLVSMSWSADGNLLATGNADGTLKVWTPGRHWSNLDLQGHPAGLSSVAFSPDGSLLVTGCLDRTTRIWDVSSGRKRLEFGGHELGVNSVSWSPDGARLATGSRDATARVWEADRGRELIVFRGHTESVTRAEWSRDGKRLATSSEDKSARVWDSSSGQPLLKLAGHSAAVLAVSWSPDGTRLATGSSDGTARLWDARDGAAILTLEGHASEVSSVAWSPDGRRLFTGSRDGTARVWGAGDGRELLSLKAHTTGVCSACWSPDGMRLATGGMEGGARIWTAASAQMASAWSSEERLVQELLDRNAFRGQGARGFFRDWLVLLPLPFLPEETGAAALERQQLAGEAHLSPREGEEVPIAGRKLSWRAHRAQESLVDFNAVLAQVAVRSVAYAVCYLDSDRARNDLWLQVSSDDEAKVYLNGAEIYRCRVRRPLEALDTAGPVALKAGSNLLVLKVANEEKEWESCVRLVDEAGRPAEGVRARLAP